MSVPGIARGPYKTKVPAVDRFFSKLAYVAEGCWIWLGWRNNRGYGAMAVSHSRKRIYVHRFSYLTFRGPIQSGMHLDHLCRTPACANPWHLEAVTPTENVRRGSAAKITKSQAEEIRRLYSEGGLLQRELGARFGIEASVVSRIVTGERWN